VEGRGGRASGASEGGAAAKRGGDNAGLPAPPARLALSHQGGRAAGGGRSGPREGCADSGASRASQTADLKSCPQARLALRASHGARAS